MPDVLRVTDDTSRELLGALIRQANREAKRAPRICKLFERDRPTRWDDAHADIDALLEDWLDAR